MKNYMCIGIYKKVSRKEVVLSKGKAYEKFWDLFGNEIEEEWKAEEKRLLRLLMNYEKKLKKSNGKDEDVAELKEERTAKLHKLRVQMNIKSCHHIFARPHFKKNLEKDASFLRVCGVYKLSDNRFAVVEETYCYVIKTIEDAKNKNQIFCYLSEQMRNDCEARLIVPEETGEKKAKKFISKERQRIVNEHKKDKRWIKITQKEAFY